MTSLPSHSDEMYGLQVIVNGMGERGTIHCIAPPPERSDYASDEKYDEAHRKWQYSLTTWKVSRV